eukprot:4995208-Prymnesium_polylepis.2
MHTAPDRVERQRAVDQPHRDIAREVIGADSILHHHGRRAHREQQKKYQQDPIVDPPLHPAHLGARLDCVLRELGVQARVHHHTPAPRGHAQRRAPR